MTCFAATEAAVPAAGQRAWAMIHALGVARPQVTVGEDPQARLFDPFVGTWDIDYTLIKDDGSREKSQGQLVAGWILDGRALQDIWIWHQPGHTERWMGTTLRFYDTEKKLWRITWVSPFARAVTLLDGRAEDQKIVLLGDSPPAKLRWTFSDITAREFRWRGEVTRDGGVSWRLTEDHHMRRAS